MWGEPQREFNTPLVIEFARIAEKGRGLVTNFQADAAGREKTGKIAGAGMRLNIRQTDSQGVLLGEGGACGRKRQQARQNASRDFRWNPFTLVLQASG